MLQQSDGLIILMVAFAELDSPAGASTQFCSVSPLYPVAKLNMSAFPKPVGHCSRSTASSAHRRANLII